MGRMNRYLNYADVQNAINRSKNEGWEKKFAASFKNCSHFWEEDSQAKWHAIISSFETVNKSDKKLTVLDLGCGSSPLPWYFASLGHDAIGVDDVSAQNNGIEEMRHFAKWLKFPPGRVQINFADAYEFISGLENNSVDFIFDACAITHFGLIQDTWFKHSHFNKDWNIDGQQQFKRVFDLAYPKLVKGGHIIIASDILRDPLPPAKTKDDIREFLSPARIIDQAKKSNYNIVTEPQFNHSDSLKALKAPRGPIGYSQENSPKCYVGTFTFQKV